MWSLQAIVEEARRQDQSMLQVPSELQPDGTEAPLGRPKRLTKQYATTDEPEQTD